MPASPFIKTNVRKSSGRFEKYSVWWSPFADPAAIELDCIKMGGQWKKTNGVIAGEGMYYHMRRFQEIVWPEKIWQVGPFRNHWADKILECWIEAKYLGIMGCAASGKSDSLASIALTDWYPHPDCTTTLVSSTELMMLERRIWGFVKKYHKLAKQRCDWLPGQLIESKQMIIHDTRESTGDGRTYLNGLMGVACKKGNQFVGLGCFPSGTLVDTNLGPRAIESISPGELVWSANGINPVRNCSTRIATTLLRINLSDGRKIDCTPNHPFFTSLGWKHSIDLIPNDYIMSPLETLLILQEGDAGLLAESEVLQRAMQAGQLQEGVPMVQEPLHPIGRQKYFLRKILFDEVQNVGQGFCCEDSGKEGHGCDWQGGECVAQGEPRALQKACEIEQASRGSGTIGAFAQNVDYPQEEWREGFQRQGKRMPTDTSRGYSSGAISRREMEHADPGKNIAQGKRWVALGKSRLGLDGLETRRGSGWRLPFSASSNRTRHSPGQETQGAWVESVEILKREGDERYDKSEAGYRVHNLEVAGHPSYCVSGLVSHNSFIGIHNKRVRLVADEAQLMVKAFLDSTSNLSKCPDFKLIAPGNPNETTNSHGIICEPSVEMGGWEGGIDQQPGTKTWKTRWPKGMCLQLPGSDSPNLKAPESEPPPFPFLITREQIQDEAATWGRDDWHLAMFVDAKMPRGQGSHRVITRLECEKYGATLEAFWRDSNITKIASLDAAYRSSGGDRCVFTEVNFGRESESNADLISTGSIISQKLNVPQGRQILSLVDQVVIPIDAGLEADTPEAQIRKFCQAQCQARGIPPENFFLDSGMRTSLIQEMSRNWSVDIQSVDCGAAPTDQRVSAEIDMPCHDYYKKLITQIWFSIRLVIISRQFRNLSKDVMWELCAREWKTAPGNKIEVESKIEMKEKTSKSPDLGDSLGLAIFGAIKRGFQISTLRIEQPQKRNGPDWRTTLREKSKLLWGKGQLEYRSS